jgi:hypothetical protein
MSRKTDVVLEHQMLETRSSSSSVGMAMQLQQQQQRTAHMQHLQRVV